VALDLHALELFFTITSTTCCNSENDVGEDRRLAGQGVHLLPSDLVVLDDGGIFFGAGWRSKLSATRRSG